MKQLWKHQHEIMSLFYSRPLTKVLFDKVERSQVWDVVTHGGSCCKLNEIADKCPAFAHQIASAKRDFRNIQSAVFSECVYAQTLANIFRLDNFAIYEQEPGILPDWLYGKLDEECHLKPRYVYSNKDLSWLLIQAGSCMGVDSALIIVKNLATLYPIEFKEPYAKFSEHDLPKYGEDGRLIITPQFASKYPQYMPMLEEQKGLNIFELIGHNEHHFSYASINIALTQNYTYSDKYAHVVCTEDSNAFLTMIPVGDITKWALVEGEIRSAGRNHYKVWTPQRLTFVLHEKGAREIDGTISIPRTSLIPRIGRGSGGEQTGWKIDNLFFVRLEDCCNSGSRVVFPRSKIHQLRPTISAKMNVENLDARVVRNHYFPKLPT